MAAKRLPRRPLRQTGLCIICPVYLSRHLKPLPTAFACSTQELEPVLTLSKKTLFAALAALGFSALSIGTASAETQYGRSYKVAGKSYTPMTKVSSSFSQTGNASWYGNGFHGRKTASGERYNMHALTAAHRTLPMGTVVKVTNTRNGKSVMVKVNDRGPFHGNRVLDLSKAAASQLGFVSSGTAPVKIELLGRGAKAAPATTAPALIAAAPALQKPAIINTPSSVIAPKEIYVDLKTFGTEREALAYVGQANRQLAAAFMNPQVMVEKRGYEYTVKMGPFTAQERADAAEKQVREAVVAVPTSI